MKHKARGNESRWLPEDGPRLPSCSTLLPNRLQLRVGGREWSVSKGQEEALMDGHRIMNYLLLDIKLILQM
ncbi:hypothetical protein EYF80_041283 [Liparis tanakae]|uniref:Uncharacterized protein n=1 Tax=Liparis tanakae TaxID=230148 RepID=A0A4Z2G4U3_9TELE|nr:hypothetical protein EYF80_041283 [Liparis tanakae]